MYWIVSLKMWDFLISCFHLSSANICWSEWCLLKAVDLFTVFLLFIHLQYLFQSATIIVTAVVSNVWLILPAVALIIALLCIQQYYLRTSRDIKRLESIGWCLYALIPHSIITSCSTHIIHVCSSKSCLFSYIHDTSRAFFHQSTGARRNITAAVSSVPE